MAYTREEKYDEIITSEIAGHVYEILRLLGENPDREGLLKTPERVAKSLQFLTQGYAQNGTEIIRSAMFDEKYQQMVLVATSNSIPCASTIFSPSSGKPMWPIFPTEKSPA